MAKLTKDLFQKLKKLPMQKRIQKAQTEAGTALLSALTPSQFAELFPKYYERYLPDVGGFSKAISQSSKEKQQKYFDELDSKLGTTSPGAAERIAREGASRRGGGGGSTGGGRANYQLTPEQKKEMASAIRDTANKIGVKPEYLAAIMSFETGGTLDPWKAGPTTKWGQHRGLIQWGEPQAREAGISSNSLITEQVSAVGKYLQQRGVKPGMGLENIYGAVIHGSATSGLDVTDKFGTSAISGAQNMMRSGHINALANLEGGGTPSAGRGGGTSGGGEGYIAPNSGGNFNGQGFVGVGGKFQCVQYARTAGGLGHTSGWKPGQSAMGGGLKPGDWIARFNEDGSYGNQPGYSHVARFEGYKRDEKGNILGMYVTQQYGSTKVHSAFIPAGGNNPEFDANNYHHIHDQGKPASMHTSDGTDEKVRQREEHFKNHPNDIEPETHVKEQKTQVTPVQVSAPPMPHPAASAPQSADLNETVKLHKEKYLNEVIKKHPAAETPMFGPGRSGVWKQTIDGLKEAGVPYKETSEGIEVNISRKDPRYKKVIQDMRDNELDPKQFLDKIKYTSGGEQPTASTHAQAMRSKIEGYYGKSINDHEYDMLIRATHAESTARKHTPEEHAMIMGTILNRAKKEGGIEKALMRNKQFESVTGRTRGKFRPNPAYKAGPSVERMGSIYQGVVDHLHRVPSSQEYFASATKKTKFGKQIESGKLGSDHTRHADSVFNSKLKDVTPEVKTAQEGPPPGAIPIDQTKPQEPGATTPKPVATEPPKPTIAEKIQKEVFPGGGTQAQAKPATPAPVTTPSATPTPVTPSTPAPKTTSPTPTEGVVGASSGGSFNVGDSNINFYPLDKKDNMAAVDTKTQQPLFTARSDENIQYDGQQNRVNVTPNQKVNGNGMTPTADTMRSEFNALRQEMSSMRGAGQQAQPQQTRAAPQSSADTSNFVSSMLKQNKQPFNNPAFERAMNRTRLQEHGDSLNNHFSSNNTNQ